MSKISWKPGNMLYPLPAVMVSCMREGERPNIITLAWAGTICSDPVMLSISVRKERYSHSIIKDTGEFVVNLTTKELAFATDYCGVRSGRDVDKFMEMDLTCAQSVKIKAPGIAESPVNLECVVEEIKELGTHDMFIARVVSVNVESKYMNETGRFDLNSAELITYSHGSYFGLGEKIGTFGYSVKKPDVRKMTTTKKTRINGQKSDKSNERKTNKKNTGNKTKLKNGIGKSAKSKKKQRRNGGEK